MRTRVFQDVTGFFFCGDDSDTLDARGPCFPTAAEATREAVRHGEMMLAYSPNDSEAVELCGSGVDRAVARDLGVKVVD